MDMNKSNLLIGAGFGLEILSSFFHQRPEPAAKIACTVIGGIGTLLIIAGAIAYFRTPKEKSVESKGLGKPGFNKTTWILAGILIGFVLLLTWLNKAP